MMTLPAPWGEMEIPSIITVTFPTEAMSKVKNIKALGNFYVKIFKYFVELMGTSKIHNHERLVFDKQIAAGNVFLLELICILETSCTSFALIDGSKP